MTLLINDDHWLNTARRVPSPFCDARPNDEMSLLVVHNISLPPGKFGGPYIEQLFTGQLNPADDPYFEIIHQFRVSAHCLIRRDGEIVQFVPFNQRAWHAGTSRFEDRDKCNDFSIGIELEGTDYLPYTSEQYQMLTKLTQSLMSNYPAIIRNRVTGHEFIAPGRKTDPGLSFDWQRFKKLL